MKTKHFKIFFTIFITLFFLNSFSQTKTNTKKQKKIILVVDDFIEIMSIEDSKKKHHLTLTLQNANPDKEYIFTFENDNKIVEYKIITNYQYVISYDESFKILSSEILKYKIKDKKKLLK